MANLVSISIEFSRLPNSVLISNVIESSTSNPFQSSTSQGFRFCVPEEWFRRSKSRVTALPLLPSQSTTKHMIGSDEDASTEDEGTAKQQRLTEMPHPLNERRDPDWLSSLSQSRLSNLFDGWLSTSASTSPTRANTMFASDRINVSEPKLVEHRTGDARSLNGDGDPTGDSEGEEPDTATFEQMLVSRFLR